MNNHQNLQTQSPWNPVRLNIATAPWLERTLRRAQLRARLVELDLAS